MYKNSSQSHSKAAFNISQSRKAWHIPRHKRFCLWRHFPMSSPFFIFYKRKISACMPKFLLKKSEGKAFGFPSKHAGCTGNQGTRSAYAVYRWWPRLPSPLILEYHRFVKLWWRGIKEFTKMRKERGYVSRAPKKGSGEGLPAGFLYARNLAFIRKFPETDAAKFEFAVYRMRTPASLAACVSLNFKFRLTFLFDNHRFLCHDVCLLSMR